MGKMEMKPARKLSILALFAVTAFSASALTVAVAPAEERNDASAQGGKESPIRYLVSGCLNSLFDAGFIATDSGVSRVQRDSWWLADYGLADARDGLVDYVIAVFVEWAPSSFHKGTALPVSVDFRLVRVFDGKVLAEGSVSGPPDSENAASQESKTASQAGAAATESCMKLLSTLVKGGE